jgi:hypothetical protein
MPLIKIDAYEGRSESEVSTLFVQYIERWSRHSMSPCGIAIKYIRLTPRAS